MKFFHRLDEMLGGEITVSGGQINTDYSFNPAFNIHTAFWVCFSTQAPEMRMSQVHTLGCEVCEPPGT